MSPAIVQLLIQLVIALEPAVAELFVALIQRLTSAFTPTALPRVLAATDVVVRALIDDTLFTNTEKRQIAFDAVSSTCAIINISIDDSLINTLIELSLQKQKQARKGS